MRLAAFFGSGNQGAFQWEGCCVLRINSAFVVCYDPRDEVLIVYDTIQQPLIKKKYTSQRKYNRNTNFGDISFIFNSSLTIRWNAPYKRRSPIWYFFFFSRFCELSARSYLCDPNARCLQPKFPNLWTQKNTKVSVLSDDCRRKSFCSNQRVLVHVSRLRKNVRRMPLSFTSIIIKSPFSKHPLRKNAEF
jgi:hypothetical protein